MRVTGAVRWAAMISFGQAALLGVGIYLIHTYLIGSALDAAEDLSDLGTLAVSSLLIYCVNPLLIMGHTLCGVGLLLGWRWVRTAALIFAVINGLIFVGVGTTLSIITAALLLRAGAEDAAARSAPGA